jgi:hypothetical protein
MMKVAEEIRQREAEVDAIGQRRFFETTNKSTYVPKSYQENTIGRRVMKTTDGKPVSMNLRDEQLIVEHGTWRRMQKCSDDDLWMRIPKGDYTQQQPVTLWTHFLERKNFQNSAGVGPNPFARTSGFTQTSDQVKSISGYYGNIDFEQEAAKIDFRKTKGTDLNLTNPYIETEAKVSNLAQLKERVIEGCKTMSPANGYILEITVQFGCGWRVQWRLKAQRLGVDSVTHILGQFWLLLEFLGEIHIWEHLEYSVPAFAF